MKETDRNKLEKYLRIFDKVKYPYDYQPILKLAGAKVKRTDRMVEYAANALKYFTGKDIRNLAIDKLSIGKHAYIYTDLLIGNYKNGDGQLLRLLVEKARNENDVHSLVFGYVSIYSANNTKDCKGPLMALYDRMNCGIHREDLIRIMLENGVLPANVKKEIKYDSYDKTRTLYRK